MKEKQELTSEEFSFERLCSIHLINWAPIYKRVLFEAYRIAGGFQVSSFERLCSLPQGFVVRNHGDAVKLINAHLFRFKCTSFKRTQFCKKQNKYFNYSFLL